MDWIKSLEPGDEVLAVTVIGGGFHHMEKKTVRKITPAGFVKVGEGLYRPDTGHIRGEDTWTAEYIADLSDPKVIEMYEEQKSWEFRSRVLRRMERLTDITADQAKAICKIMGWRYE